MDQPLFVAALAGITISAYYRYPEGWVVHVATRNEGDLDWTQEGSYDRLSTDEALDVIEASIDGIRARRRRVT